MKKLTLLMICLTLFIVHALADIVIVEPKEGEKITMNFPYAIKWKSPDVPGNVKIRLLQDNSGVGAITISTENDGNFTWKIVQLADGSPINTGEKYRIKIISLNDNSVYGLSGEFSLRKVILSKKPPLIIKKDQGFTLLSDLFIDSITVSKYDPAYKTVFTVNVKNSAGATSGPAELLVWLFKLLPDGKQPATADESWSGTVPTDGGSIAYMVTVPWTHDKYGAMAQGNWRVVAKVNPRQTIPEKTLENNQLSFDFTIPN